MELNIKPEKIYKIIRESGKPRKDEVLRCVEMMSWEAEELSAAWKEIIRLSNKKGKISEKEKNLKTKLFSDNAPLYGRLLHFYKNMAKAKSNKQSLYWLENIYNRVAEVILHKSDIKKSVEDLSKIKTIQSPLYLNAENNGMEIDDLNTSLQILQKETAALKALPELFKNIKV